MIICNCCGGYPYTEGNEGAPESQRCNCNWEDRQGPEELGRDARGVVWGWGPYSHCTTHNYSTDTPERAVTSQERK